MHTNGENRTNFYRDALPPKKNSVFVTYLIIGSVWSGDKSYNPQTLLDDCKYFVTNNNLTDSECDADSDT